MLDPVEKVLTRLSDPVRARSDGRCRLAAGTVASVRDVDAELLARKLLASYDDRWLHTQGVVAAARSLGGALGGADAEVLVTAGWLHDVGYARPLAVTGFHPLDGARWLRERDEHRLAGLVANHTAAGAADR